MDAFWIMIIAVVIFALGGLATALYARKLFLDFPKVVKAKVMREEKLEFVDPTSETTKVRYRYHFKGRDNGNKMMTDTITYKEKKFKVGERVSVHMGAKGGVCHSNMPLWPVATSIICILMAIVSVFIYVSATRTTETTESTLQFDNGYYIVTDTDVLFQGDSLGLVILDGDNSLISTGDYGAMLYQDDAHDHSDSILPVVHSLSSNVSTDGTYETLSAEIVAQVESLGYVIDTVSTDSVELMEALGLTTTEEEEHDHDHEDVVENADESVADETETSPVESETTDTNPETEETADETVETSDEVFEITTTPTETETTDNN